MANLVQRGSVQFGATTTATITLGTAVDTSKTFIRTWQAVSGQSAPQVYQAEVYFTTLGSSVSSITCKRYTGTGTPTVYVEVITLDNISVQHFNNVAFLSTDTALSRTLTTIGGTNKAFALTSGITNTATTTSAHLGFFRANITSTTNVTMTRGASGSIGEVSVQVVEFTDSTIVEHKTITANATSVTSTLTNTIDPTKHFVFYNFSSTGGVLDCYPQIYLSGTNTINVNRSIITGATSTVEAYVVIAAGTTVEVDTGADLATTSNAITVSNVTDTTLAFTIPSWGNSGSGSSWPSQLGEAIMISTTEVDLNIFAAGNTTPYALQTIQLPSSFIKTTTSITKSLQYAIRQSPAITKSLQYEVKAPAAITKSLTYDVRKSVAAITKSLQYTLKKATSITKSLQYSTPGIVNVIQNGSGTDTSSYTTASITPTANTLHLFTVVSRTGTSVNPNQPTVTGAGLTWVAINSVVFDDTSSSRRRVTLFRALGASPSTGALTISFGGQTQTSADWALDKVPGGNISGTNGSGVIVQNVTNLDDSGTATSLSATLSTIVSGNWTYAAWGYGNPGNAATAGTGYAKLSEFTEGEAGSAVITEWSPSGATAAALSVAAGGELGVIAIELSRASVSTSAITKSLAYSIKKSPSITKALQYALRLSHDLKFSLLLNGTDNKAAFTPTANQTQTTSITLSIWAKLGIDGTNSPNSQPLLSYGYTRLYVRNGNAVRVRYDETAAHEAIDSAGLPAGDTGWHHYVGVYQWTSGTSVTLKIYRDGVLKATSSNSILPTTFYGIGSVGNSGGAWFTGTIGSVKVYHAVPLDADVTALYSSDTDFATPQHVFNWSEGTGTTSANTGSQANPATLSGTGASSLWAQPRAVGTTQKFLQYAVRQSITALSKSLQYAIRTTPVGLNLLGTDGDFESGSGTTTSSTVGTFTSPGWAITSASGTLVSIDSTVAELNSKSLKIAVDGSSSNSGIKSASDLAVDPNTGYVVSYWAKSDTAGQLQLQIREHNGSGNYVQNDGTTWNATANYFADSTTTSWQLFSHTIRTQPGQTTIGISDFKRSGLATQAGRTFWIDDVRICKAPALTKQLAYAIRKSLPITKSLQYAVKKATAITKALKYGVRTSANITKSLKYTVKKPSTLKYALQFDGSTSYATIADSSTIRPETGNRFSVAFWVYVQDYDNNSLPRLWEKRSQYMAIMGDPSNGQYRRVAIEVKNDTGLGNANGGVSEFWGSTRLNLNQWYHIAATFDAGAAGTSQGIIYINGVAETMNNIFGWTSNLESTTGFDMYLARRHTDMLRNFRGMMDEFMFWQNQVLTPTEISNLYSNGTIPGSYKMYLPMDEGTGTTSADSSANSNNAALTATTWAGGALLSAIQKSLRYAIKRPSSITKSLQYVIKRKTALTQSLTYNLTGGHRLITRSLQYAIRTNNNVHFSADLNGTSVGVVSVADNPIINASATNFSVAYTAKLRSNVAPNLYFPGLQKGTFNLFGFNMFHTNLNSTQMRFQVRLNRSDATPTNDVIQMGVGGYDATAWHRFAWTFDNGSSKLFIDGVIVATKTHGTGYGSILTNTSALSFGTEGGRFFDGNLDNIQVYTRTLSDTEVGTDATGTLPDGTSKAVDWRFVEGRGTTTRDFSGNSISPTLGAGVSWGIGQTLGATQKVLQYAIRKSITSITQSLQYTIKKNTAVSKSLKYTIRRSSAAITKSLRYAIKRPGLIALAMKYRVIAFPLPDGDVTVLRQSQKSDVVISTEVEIQPLRATDNNTYLLDEDNVTILR